MNDSDPNFSKLILAHALLSAGLNLASSVRTRGVRHSTIFLALGAGLPAVAELLATGPLGLLRHRVRPQVAGVPVALVPGWYCVIHGSLAVALRILERLSPEESAKRAALPPVAALVGVSLDLILDPAGLDAGLWEWSSDGAYAPEIEGTNGHGGVPIINYLGWTALVAGVVTVHGMSCEDEGETLPALLLLPYYLAAVGWAMRRRKFRLLLYSAPFPVALYAGLKEI
ncbi:MAG TPA: carotenoid biosynthesis protein [Rubrobacter sp.]|nr:carotenoid biosynthesis protein [Rubrobacter sp.]